MSDFFEKGFGLAFFFSFCIREAVIQHNITWKHAAREVFGMFQLKLQN